jgi:hypothetical protein
MIGIGIPISHNSNPFPKPMVVLLNSVCGKLERVRKVPTNCNRIPLVDAGSNLDLERWGLWSMGIPDAAFRVPVLRTGIVF